MARSRQSVKRHRTDELKRERNHRKLKRLRTALKKVSSAETPEEKENAKTIKKTMIFRKYFFPENNFMLISPSYLKPD